ncbi:MAG: PIN domain-containing protein [Microthrixaceae bacterium]|nr:PIN domain-containing protein [Microthrixaceae bacterium]
MTVVLDSWAVLRYLEDEEPASSLVADLLERSRPLMSWINIGEVHYVVRRIHGHSAASQVITDLKQIVDAHLPDEALVLEASSIKADYPLAYADAFAAALAMTNGAELWTGDPELLIDGAPWRWKDLRPGVL